MRHGDERSRRSIVHQAAGVIADFDVTEVDNEVHVQVWPSDDSRPRNRVHQQVALMLSAGCLRPDSRHLVRR